MKKYVKFKLFSCVLIIFVLAFPSFSFADTNEGSQSLTNEDCVDELNIGQLNLAEENSIVPFTSCYGDGGVSRLDWMQSERAFSWSVDPKWSTVMSFSGAITVVDTSATLPIPQMLSVGCTSVLGNQCGEIEYFSGISGHVYTATLAGVASDATGLKYLVNCAINFMYL